MRRTTMSTTMMLVLLVSAVSFVGGSQPVEGQAEVDFGLEDWAFPDEAVDGRAPVNGCGSQGDGGTDVPDQIGDVSFTPACNWHDRCYGTKGMTQSHCDVGMLAKMRGACADKAVCGAAANVYYLAVAVAGEDPYNDGQRTACDKDPRKPGRIHGDPHIVTLDGANYSLMAAGEFSLLRDAAGDDLIQARFFPRSENFTVITGAAVQVGNRNVVLDQNPETSEVTVTIDGQPVTRAFAAWFGGDLELGIGVPGTQQVITMRGWDGFRIDAAVYEGRMDLSVFLPESMWGEVSGLLGDADGDPENDLVDGNGTVLAGQAFSRGVYEPEFVDFYRISPDNSLFTPNDGFDYHADDIGKYPGQILTLGAFTEADITAAEQRCQSVAVDGQLFDTCVLDVLLSGDDSFADSAALSAARTEQIAHPGESRFAQPSPQTPAGEPTLADQAPLVDAIEANDIALVRQLLDAGADPDLGRSSDELFPLSLALLRGNDEIIQLLIDRGANVNASGPGMIGPLAVAILGGSSTDLVQRLLDAGADPDGRTGGPETAELSPLGAAATRDDVALAKLLIDAGASIDGTSSESGGSLTPLDLAALAGGIEMVQFLLEQGADPDGSASVNGGVGPLSSAAINGNVEIVRLLVNAGADPATAIFDGADPALFIQNQEILDLLDF